ncbi:mitotic spindle assembly checkpoint protein MAD2A-like [Anopheles albimanus]|uniref:Uncharacterized protein n=1 Tax=Anopheles albimanus TaxID=7167 RepID=A0A182FNA3_ANOAL|nr:mitotic spindle assembly checkpoint protein MAD2A-like [Anopheles albimanus]
MATEQDNIITLEGSSEMIGEYLRYAVNSILFQRGIYPAQEFETSERYGVPLYLSKNDGVKRFFDAILPNIEEWCCKKCIESVMLVMYNVRTKEVVERWDFNIKYEMEGMQQENVPPGESGSQKIVSHKPVQKIRSEIRGVMRQIASSIAFLPLLDFPCTFDVLIRKSGALPQKWNETGSIDVSNPQTVHMRQFSTGIHQMATSVTYSLQHDN